MLVSTFPNLFVLLYVLSCCTGESRGSLSRDEHISQVAQDIQNKLPELFDIDVIRKRFGTDISPTSVVLLQELERFNKLLVRIQQSLAELQRVRIRTRYWGDWILRCCFFTLDFSLDFILLFCVPQALAGEVGMSSELDEVAQALYNGHIPAIWKKLAPETLKSLGNWMIHFKRRYEQYSYWVNMGTSHHIKYLKFTCVNSDIICS